MAVIEQERIPATRPERAIFVASDGRRARRLRRAGFAVAFVACLWVVGLGVGMLGFGSLPGVSVVKDQVDAIVGTPEAPRSQPTEDASAPASVPKRSALHDEVRLAARTSQVAPPPQARTRPVGSRPVSRPPAQVTTTPPPPVAQAPVNPATRERGWSRRGSTAPPGQVRQTVTPPPPATRGERRGQDPTAPPPVPPGQVKKAQELPPPPPPSTKE
jgi:hypothetical protein